MYILAIETTGPHASAALINEKGQVRETRADGVLTHLQNLVPMVSELLEKCQLIIDDVEAIAVSEGPGSFTGIRIGVSTGRALAQAAGKPVISVPTLQAFVYNRSDETGIVCPMFDARRSQVYAGAYRLLKDRQGTDRIEELVKGGAYSLEEYLGMLEQAGENEGSQNMVLFGDGIAAYGDQSKARIPGISFAEEAVRLQTAASVARLSLGLYKEGQLASYEALVPNYMRKAEAQRKLEEGTLKCAAGFAGEKK